MSALQADLQLASHQGDYSRAEMLLLHLTETYPEDVHFQLELAHLYFQIGAWEKSRKRLEHLLSKNDELIQAWELLGLVYLRLATLSYIEVDVRKEGDRSAQILMWLTELQSVSQSQPFVTSEKD